MEKTFNVSLLTGPLSPAAKEMAVNEMHITAFDYYYPVGNFLFHLGIKDRDRFIRMVADGVRVEAEEDIESAAKEFIGRWIQLIRDAKEGKEIKTPPTFFGHITIKYNKESLLEKEGEKERFAMYVGAVCALAKLDAQKVMEEMFA